MLARLVGRGWVRRAIELELSDGHHLVEYDGRGMGYEQVTVDGLVIRDSDFFWCVPEFRFKMAGLACVIKIRMWPWLTLRSIAFFVDNQLVYAEGLVDERAKQLKSTGDWAELD